VSDAAVKIEMKAARNPFDQNSLRVIFLFSNNSYEPITELHFQLAAPKVGYFFFHSFLFYFLFLQLLRQVP